MWTYFPSVPTDRAVIIIDPTDLGDAPDSSTQMLTNDYSTLLQHGGPVHALNEVPPALFLGAGVSRDTNGFVDGVDDSGNATDDDDDALGTLAAPPVSGQYSLTNIPVRNATAGNATLHAWIDFNRDGAFEVGEGVSSAIAPNQTTTNLTWIVPPSVSPGLSYVRFRLTTDALSDNDTTPSFDERSVGIALDGEVEDYQITLLDAGAAPQVLLVKRITAVGESQETNLNDGTALDQFVDVTTGPHSADDNHPHWPTDYLLGAPHGGDVRSISEQSADSVEYTIYFLSVGGAAARGVLLCDRIPPNTTFLPQSYAEAPPPHPLATPTTLLSIRLSFQGDDYALTGVSDGDPGYYFPAGVEPSTQFPNINCGGPNDNGAVVVDLSDLPPATGVGLPTNAYGAVRFQVQVQ